MTNKPLTIGARLALGYGAFFLLMIVLSLLAAGRVAQIDRALDHINDVTSVKQRYAVKLRASVRDRAIALRDVVLAADAARAAAPVGLIKTLDDNYARSASPMDALFHELPDVLPAEKDLLAAIKEQERRTRPLIDRVVALHAAGEVAQAQALLAQQAAPAFVDWLASINGFIELQEKLHNEDAAAARVLASGFPGWMLLLFLCAIVTGAFSAWYIARGLQRQFDRDAAVARRIGAAGEPAPEAAPAGGQPAVQVAQVAQTMAAITASSRKIVEIIGMADGLAFQATVLALNAAVDAVHADARGRVSPVVATEISTLAQRSALAARDIRELICSSVERAEEGARLVDEARSKLEDIVSSARRVAELMGASSPAAEPVRQLGQADGSIGQMNDALSQNGVLVQQASAAASSLEAEAGRLAQAVGELRLDRVEPVESATL